MTREKGDLSVRITYSTSKNCSGDQEISISGTIKEVCEL